MPIESLTAANNAWPEYSAATSSPVTGLRSLSHAATAIPRLADAEQEGAAVDALQDAVQREEEQRQAFHQMVGQTLFGQMLSSMRKTVGKPAYMHGGRAEEVFQAQLDQVLAEKLTEASSESLSQPMYELFRLPRP